MCQNCGSCSHCVNTESNYQRTCHNCSVPGFHSTLLPFTAIPVANCSHALSCLYLPAQPNLILLEEQCQHEHRAKSPSCLWNQHWRPLRCPRYQCTPQMIQAVCGVLCSLQPRLPQNQKGHPRFTKRDKIRRLLIFVQDWGRYGDEDFRKRIICDKRLFSDYLQGCMKKKMFCEQFFKQ